jgi:hypothetical protein
VNVAEYRKAQAAIAQQTEEKVAALYGVFASPTRPLSPEEFADFLGFIVGNANTKAAVLADVFQSGRLRRKPRGIGRPTDEPAALREAVKTLLADAEDPLPRLRRLARSEPVQASRQAARETLERHKVTHYRWQLSSSKSACGLCKFLARRKWPVKKVPVSHPSCTCQVVPA